MSNQANGNGSAIVKGPQARLDAIKGELRKASPLLKAMLPKHVEIDRMVRIVTSAVSRTPELLECSPRSIVLATAQACALGLEPNTPLGLGYLVPFKKEAQFIPGYRGLTRLAVQSGEVRWIQARAVHAKDTLEIDYGTEQRLVHRPTLGDAGELIGVYAVAEMKNGSKVFEFMTISEVHAIKERSKASANGPWITDFEEMAKKTVVRRLCKSLPLSEEQLARALNHQAQAESGKGPDFSDVIDVLPEEQVDPETGEVTGEQPKSRTDEMKERLAAKAS